MPRHSIAPSTPTQAFRATIAVFAAIALAVALLPGAGALARAQADEGGAEDEGALATLTVRVQSADTAMTGSNALYDLSGARVGVYTSEGCEDSSLAATVGFDAADGEADVTEGEDGALSASVQLAEGTYYLKLRAAGSGYVLDGTTHELAVEAESTSSLSLALLPQCAAGAVVQKVNAETGNAAAAGGASLQGAQFELCYFGSGEAGTRAQATRTWVLQSDENGEVAADEEHYVSGDGLYTSDDGQAALPLGTYTVAETLAPAGYVLDEELHTFTIEGQEGATEQLAVFGGMVKSAGQVLRGDVAFTKVDDEGNALAGVPFLVSYDNGEDGVREQHVVVTGADGGFSSAAAAHSVSTNANDAALTADGDGGYSVDESLLDAGAGVWFSMDAEGATAAAADGLGALPFGSYRIQELPCTANAFAKELLEATFTLDEDGACVELGALENELARLSASATDAAGTSQRIAAEAGEQIVITASYRNLVVGQEYLLSGSVVLAESGEQLLDGDGVAVGFECELLPSTANDTTEQAITLDATELAGQQLAVLVELSSGGSAVASCSGLEDSALLIEVLPRIGTSARDAADGDGYLMGTEAGIVDTVAYEGLECGQTYKLDARLMDAETGNVACNEDGTAIAMSLQFEAESASGSAEVELSFTTGLLEGHDVVVFEVLRDADDVALATHEELDCEEQTVKTAGISTVACDAADGDKFFYTADEAVTVSDEVTYANLEAGETYELLGTLVDAATGEALEEDGQAVTGGASFTAEEAAGTATVQIAFSPSAHSGLGDVVVFESLRYEGVEIATHADAADENQTLTGLTPEETIVLAATGSTADDADADAGADDGGSTDANENADDDADATAAVGTGDYAPRLALACLATTLLASLVALAARAWRRRTCGAHSMRRALPGGR